MAQVVKYAFMRQYPVCHNYLRDSLLFCHWTGAFTHDFLLVRIEPRTVYFPLSDANSNSKPATISIAGDVTNELGAKARIDPVELRHLVQLYEKPASYFID